MEKKEFASILTEILVPIGFKKKGDYWVVNGDGSGPVVYALRMNSSTNNFLYEFGMGGAATTKNYLGRRIENNAKWDGTFRYGGSKNVLSQAVINAKAIARQPLIKSRPINILRQYGLPRAQALKLGGNITALYTVGKAGYDGINGNISYAHSLTTIGITALGMGAATVSAPIAVPAIIIGGLYGYYEDDIWHNYDKQNAENFKEE